MSNYFNRRLIQFLVAIFVLINRTQATDKKNQVVEDRNTGVLEFIVQTCTSLCNCQPVTLGLVVDNNWRGVYYNLCYDPKQCDMIPTVNDYKTLFGLTVSPSKTSLTLDYIAKAPGARIYLTSGPSADSYQMVYLLNREISVDVDMSTAGCGMNVAFFFVGMEADGGKAKFGYKGPFYGTGYCDAALAQGNKPNCIELDVIESNSLTSSLTTHTCKAANDCEPSGCSFMPYPLGKKNFFGRGSSYSVDTTKPFTLTTRFITDDGKDTGNLKEIQQIYKQNGKKIPNPTVAGNFSSLSDAYCSYYKLNNLGGISASMTQGLKNGMVLTMGLWGNVTNPDFMYWLDQPPNGPCPVYSNLNPKVIYSNIKYGFIGSTA